MTTPTRRTVLRTLGLGGAAMIAGTGTAAASGGEAKVRVAHASPDAPAVDVYVGTDPSTADPTIGGLEFTDVTGYLEVPAGSYEVTITAAGSKVAVPPSPLTLTLDDEDYTVAAIGELAPEGDEPSFTVDVFMDKLGVLRGDTGRVRAYHAAPDVPPVDVAVAGQNDEPALYLAKDLAFGEAGPNAEVPADTYPVAIYLAGDTSPTVGPIDVEVKAGEVLTAFAMGNLWPEAGDAGFTPVLAYEDAAPFGMMSGGPPARAGGGPP